MIGQLLNNRYKIESEIGRGGMGVVYRAQDSLLARRVAIKVLSSSMIGTEGRARLLREAQAAARMNHPNIVSIYDAGEIEGLSFIIMELLEGSSLAERKSVPLAELIPIARQVCAALQHAHQLGIIHRDLKPENVFITAQNTAKLTDFGLARSTSSRLTADGALVGTVFYMAPEQAMGNEMDSRTDLYALGAMLYELSTGRLPFHASDPVAVISQHLYAPVIPPSNYNPALPSAWDDMVLHLMSKRMDDRPANAAEVLAALQQVEELLRHGSNPNTAHSPLERLGHHYLVGRDLEFTQAKTLWMQAISGTGSDPVLLISGEPGVGKTPLLREIKAFAEIAGGKIVQGECYAEGGTPYAPLAQIIRAALDAQGTPPPGGRKNTKLPAALLADLIAIAPDLRLHFPNIVPNPSLEPQAEQARLFESFVALCMQLAVEEPLLMVVEDLQWADGSSLHLLRHLARRARTARIQMLIVMTYREGVLAENPLLNNVVMDLQRERLAARIKLTRFDRSGTRLVLQAILDGEIAEDLVDAVYHETEGNQFFIDELVKTLVENNQITCRDNVWQRSKPGSMQLPQSVRATIQERVSKLPENAQEMLRLAAVIGQEFEFATLQKASESDDEDRLIQAIELAVQARIIQEVPGKGETFAFSHGLFPATLRDSLSSLRRHRLHRRVGSVIASLRPDDYATLAYHALAAGDESGARQNYLKAAEHAAAVYASSDVVRYLSQVLELTPATDPERFPLLQKRLQHNGLVGQRNAQLQDVQAMLALAEQLKDKRMRIDALLNQAELFYEIRPLSSLAPAEQAATLAEKMGDLARQGRALKLQGIALRWRGKHSESRALIERAIACYEEAGLPEKHAAAVIANCQHNLSLILGDLGEHTRALEASQKGLDLSRQAGDRGQEGTSLRRLAIVHMNQNQHAAGLPYAQQALKIHQELVDRIEEMHDLNVLGILTGWLGQSEKSQKYFNACLELAENLSTSLGLMLAITNYVEFLFMLQTKYEAGLAFVDERIERHASLEDPTLMNSLYETRIRLLGALGLQKRALEEMDALEIRSNNETSAKGKLFTTIYRAQLNAELGDFEQAWKVITICQELAQAEKQPTIHLASLYLTQAYITFLQQKPQLAYEAAQNGIAILDENLEAAIVKANLAAVQALSLVELGRADEALSHSTQAVQLASQRPFPDHLVDYVQYRVLDALGKDEEAREYLQNAHQHIQRVAENTLDPELKRAWLENIPINRMILEALQVQEV